MDELLKPLSTTYKTPGRSSSTRQKDPAKLTEKERHNGFSSRTPEGALDALKDQPDFSTLVAVLKYLTADDGWNVKQASSQASQIVSVLVKETAPNYWPVLREDATITNNGRIRVKAASDLAVFLQCLRSTTGVNAILRLLDAQILEARKGQGAGSDMAHGITSTLELFSAVLDGDDFVAEMLSGVAEDVEDRVKRKILMQEVTNLLGGGKVVARVAEAQLVGGKSGKDGQVFWMADGKEYSAWLSRNTITWIKTEPTDEMLGISRNLLSKAFRLGYSDVVLEHLFDGLTLDTELSEDNLSSLLKHMARSDQRRLLLGTLKILSNRYLNALGQDMEQDEGQAATRAISAAAKAISRITGNDSGRQELLREWLSSSSGAGMGEAVGVRRAAVAVFGHDRDLMLRILTDSLNQFGDQLYIRHAPSLQQEAHAQVLLLAAGHVHRMNPAKLALTLRSSIWLNAISNRLGSSQSRARWLGMVVGEALSGLTDNNEKKLDFHMAETNSKEGSWYKSLVHVQDDIAPNLSQLLTVRKRQEPKAEIRLKAKTAPISRPSQPRPSGFVIEEVDGDESEDDDLTVYNKPDSDVEDSDKDPTLVRREKPKAPVYVRDLIRYFRDTENYDHQKLALTAAPALIRRKKDYGTEVKDHIEELASLIVGLQDKYEIDGFDDLRLQGMIAVIYASPRKMGAWFAKTFFDGDYSISQRVSILVALGLSARELGGHEQSRYAASASFPSKTLPAKVERLYLQDQRSRQLSSTSNLKALPPNALDHVAKTVTSDFLAPIAATAADSATGPDALKLSTYASRLKRVSSTASSIDGSVAGKKAGPVVKVIPNSTAELLSTAMFYPLTARFQAATRSSSSRAHSVLFQPYLLSVFLKTLALILHAAGPSTLSLPDMTIELWTLLLSSSVRAHAAGDLGLIQAVLFAVLALLDVNESRMRDLCRDHGREVIETQDWVGQIFENTRGDDGGEENEVKMLAAGILIRLREGIEKYRMLLIGDMIDVR